MAGRNEILIEGFNSEELKELSASVEFQEIVFSNKPLIINAGSSEILGSFKRNAVELEVTLSHITGGGEGVLLKVMNLFREFGRQNGKERIIWKVHAVSCPKPNPKLPRILEMKKFKIVDDTIDGSIYQKIESL